MNNRQPAQSLEYDIEVCMASDAGCRREQNEDRILFVKPAASPQPEDQGILAIVADGMGGHRAGAVASQLAVEIVSREYYQQRQDNVPFALKQALTEANREIYQASLCEPSWRGMGTTLTALVLNRGQVHFAHVGDSRLYRLSEGRLSLLTEDHTLVKEMLKDGLISAEEAEHHPNRNIITRALGTHPGVEISTSRPLPALKMGDYFILCSDGLYDLVSDKEIEEAVLSHLPRAACERLIKLAKERGGHDNISVGILAIQAMGRLGKVPRDTATLEAPLS